MVRSCAHSFDCFGAGVNEKTIEDGADSGDEHYQKPYHLFERGGIIKPEQERLHAGRRDNHRKHADKKKRLCKLRDHFGDVRGR